MLSSMRTNRWWWCGVLMTLLACRGEDTSAFSVALLLAGPENDEGWNQSAYEGLQRIKQDLGARTRKVTARSPVAIRQALSQAAESGFQLVIGHGFEFNAPAHEMATAFPQVAFVTTGGDQTTANLASIVMRVEEAAYAIGVLAGHLSTTGKVSAISGEPFEPVRRVVSGFRAGFQSLHPDGQVIEEYLGSWEDAALAKEKAFAHADAGADVFFQNADAAGIGIFEACRARGWLAFGCNRDQASKAPDVIVASAVADIPETLLALAQEALSGNFRGGVRSFGMEEGKTRVVVNPLLQSRIPAAAERDMEQAVQRLRRGEIELDAP